MVTVSTIAERNAVPNAIRYVLRADGLIDVYQVGDTLPDGPAAEIATWEIQAGRIVVTGLTGDAIQAALDAASAGSEIYLLGARYVLDAAVVVGKAVSLRGVPGMTELWAGSDGYAVLKTDTTQSGDISVYGVILHGYADRNPVLTSGLRGCQLQCTGRLTLEKVKAKYVRNMGLTGKGAVAVARDCEVEYSLRDAINLTGSKRVLVDGCRIYSAGDDAIAVHVEASPSATYTLDFGATVVNNDMRMCQGIKVLGAQKTIVSANRGDLLKGYGIYVAPDTGYSEGIASIADVVITDNILTNIVNPAIFGGTDILYGIYVAGLAQLGSGGLNAAGKLPGEFASGAWLDPAGLDRYAGGAVGSESAATTGSAPAAGAKRIKVRSNILSQAYPDVAAISDLGFGDGWHTSGSDDPAASFRYSGDGVRIGNNISEIEVSDNTISGWAVGISLSQWPNAADLSRWRGVWIRGNAISNAKNAGDFTQGQGGTAMIDFVVEDNDINLDPYLADADRAADGAWNNTSTSNCRAWMLNNTRGIVLRRNRYANTKQAVFPGNAQYSHTEPTYRVEIKTASTLSGQRGVDNIADIADGTLLRSIENPQSSDYGLYQGVWDYRAQRSAAIPSAGWWPVGAFVGAITPTVGAGKVLTGWARLTTGSDHVAGTDWSPVYGTTS